MKFTYKQLFFSSWLLGIISLSYAMVYRGILADETGTDGTGFLIGWLDAHWILWTVLVLLFTILILALTKFNKDN